MCPCLAFYLLSTIRCTCDLSPILGVPFLQSSHSSNTPHKHPRWRRLLLRVPRTSSLTTSRDIYFPSGHVSPPYSHTRRTRLQRHCTQSPFVYATFASFISSIGLQVTGFEISGRCCFCWPRECFQVLASWWSLSILGWKSWIDL